MGQLLLSQILERPWLQNSELKRPSSRWNVSNEICLGGVLLYLSASGASHRKVHRWFFSVLKAYIQNIPTLVNVSSHLTGGAYKGLVRWGQCWRRGQKPHRICWRSVSLCTTCGVITEGWIPSHTTQSHSATCPSPNVTLLFHTLGKTAFSFRDFSTPQSLCPFSSLWDPSDSPLPSQLTQSLLMLL